MVRSLLFKILNSGGFMQAKYLVVFIVIIAIIGGLYFFQKNRRNKELLTHKTQQLQRVKETAKKSSSAGLLVMASAINKFHQSKGHYPDTLLTLHPEFIPDKSFISELRWAYAPEKKSYRLEKSVEGGQIIASMGPDLRLKTRSGTSSTPKKMVASLNTSKSPQQPLKKKVVKKVTKTEPDAKKNIENNQLPKISYQDLMKTPTGMNSGKKKKTFKPTSSITIVKKELTKDEKFLLSFSRNGFYIWKTKDGVLGFSNIEYPDEKKTAIYLNQNWVEYIEKPNIQQN
jgi:hypothetical protein